MVIFQCPGGCNNCCGIEPGEEKKVMLFPEEVERLEKLAIRLNHMDFAVIEDLVFPDLKNRRVLVATYRLMFEKNPTCAFFRPGTGRCEVHEVLGADEKPLACRAYPVAVKRVDAVTTAFYVATDCRVIENDLESYRQLTTMTDTVKTRQVFGETFPFEFPAAEQLFGRLAWVSLRVRQLEAEGKILLPGDEFGVDEWNLALSTWPRDDLKPGSSLS